MKITKVAFEKTIGMPNYSNDRPMVVECILEGNETKEEAWTNINQDMMAWHRATYPHLYTNTGYLPPPVSQTTPGPSVMDTTTTDKDELELANDIKILQKIQYKEDAEIFLNEQVWRKYNPVLKSLVNAKPNKPL